MSMTAPDLPVDDNEVAFEASWTGKKINGFDVGQIGQNLGKQARERIKPNAKLLKFRLRLSVWIDKESL